MATNKISERNQLHWVAILFSMARIWVMSLPRCVELGQMCLIKAQSSHCPNWLCACIWLKTFPLKSIDWALVTWAETMWQLKMSLYVFWSGLCLAIWVKRNWVIGDLNVAEICLKQHTKAHKNLYVRTNPKLTSQTTYCKWMTAWDICDDHPLSVTRNKVGQKKRPWISSGLEDVCNTM